MNFLIQTVENKIVHDFSFHLVEACKFQNWITNSNDCVCLFTNDEYLPNHIPIGTVEFVCNYLDKYFGLIPKPKNIPDELMEWQFVGRIIKNGTEQDIIKESFVKSNDKIKVFTEICDKAPKGNYQISELIDIVTEWRAFIYNGELVGLVNYAGDFTKMPNIYKIRKMIQAYKTQPIAYTLDVAVIQSEMTVVIEVHDFFSCGLYGFAEYKILPFMFSKWFYSYVGGVNQNKKKS